MKSRLCEKKEKRIRKMNSELKNLEELMNDCIDNNVIDVIIEIYKKVKEECEIYTQIFIDHEDYENGISFYNTYMKIVTLMGDEIDKAVIYKQLAFLYRISEAHQNFITTSQKAIDIYSNLGNIKEVVELYACITMHMLVMTGGKRDARCINSAIDYAQMGAKYCDQLSVEDKNTTDEYLLKSIKACYDISKMPRM